MKLTSRKTHAFIHVKVDEIETFIFKDSETEIKETIFNLIEVSEELALLSGKTLRDYLIELDLI